MREKHSNPIVVDIVDRHDIFKKQWYKRRTFYKKQNYKILHTTFENYKLDKWKTVFEPILNKKQRHIQKKNISCKSNSSGDKSITEDSDEEEQSEEYNKDKLLCGKCLLKIK